MKSNEEKEQLGLELEQWFEELENDLKRSKKADTDLDRKILDDFHGHAPTIDDTFKGKLPVITPKAQIFITQNLQEGQYFRLGIEGGGCSGFNYLLDIAEKVEEHDIVFSDNPPAVVDDMSVKYLYGSEVDLYTEGMNKMLKVINPGAKASCGCGTSFAFDEDLLDMY